MRRAIASLACVLLLAGCASASGTMLSADTAIITAEGSSPAYREQVIRDALTEAARLTTAQGYRYFVVLTADDLSRTVTQRLPGRILNSTPPPRTNDTVGTFSGRPYGAGVVSYTLPDRVIERTTPAMDIIIRMYRPGEIEPAEGVFDAAAMPALAAIPQ